jgi:hypothetical protein
MTDENIQKYTQKFTFGLKVFEKSTNQEIILTSHDPLTNKYNGSFHEDDIYPILPKYEVGDKSLCFVSCKLKENYYVLSVTLNNDNKFIYKMRVIQPSEFSNAICPKPDDNINRMTTLDMTEDELNAILPIFGIGDKCITITGNVVTINKYEAQQGNYLYTTDYLQYYQNQLKPYFKKELRFKVGNIVIITNNNNEVKDKYEILSLSDHNDFSYDYTGKKSTHPKNNSIRYTLKDKELELYVEKPIIEFEIDDIVTTEDGTIVTIKNKSSDDYICDDFKIYKKEQLTKVECPFKVGDVHYAHIKSNTDYSKSIITCIKHIKDNQYKISQEYITYKKGYDSVCSGSDGVTTFEDYIKYYYTESQFKAMTSFPEMTKQDFELNDNTNVIKISNHTFVLTDDKDLCDLKIGDRFYQEIK